MLRTVLKLFCWVTGVLLIVIGVSRLGYSTQVIPGGGPVNPTVDSETRAAGPLLIFFGIGYLWAVRRSPIPAAAVRVLAATMALIGGARLLSMAATGMPHPVWTAAAVVEFAAAGLTYWYSTLGDPPAGGDLPETRGR